MQKLADDLCHHIGDCHLPPGTSKWNKVGHRLFSHITQNWRGRPLQSETIVQLIANTTTTAGLKAQCQLDTNPYPAGLKVSDDEVNALRIERANFHADWNYVIYPRSVSQVDVFRLLTSAANGVESGIVCK